MSREKSYAELASDEERLVEKMKKQKEELKALRKRKLEKARKERTHRLCTRGAMLEKYLPPEKYNDDDVKSFLDQLFKSDEAKRILSSNEKRQSDPAISPVGKKQVDESSEKAAGEENNSRYKTSGLNFKNSW